MNQVKLGAVRSAIFRAGQWTFAAIVSAVLFLPLVSLFQHPTVTLGLKALIAIFWLAAMSRPPAAVLATAVLLPLALPIEYFLGPAPDATGITEAILLAFTSGASLRLVAEHDGADRLSRPALVLGGLIAASMFVAVATQQAVSPARHIAADLWQHVTLAYLFAIGPWADVHQGMRWLSVLATAVFVERAMRREPSVAPMVMRMFLVGGAAAASFAALRVGGLLIEGRLDPSRWAILRFLLREVRISALHPDPNAAGSYFALLLVPALIIAVRQRSIWLSLGVIPLVSIAFVFAQSRAAMLAIGVVLGLAALIAMFKARRFVLAGTVLILIPLLGLAASAATQASHASLDRAAAIRQEMSLVALEMAHDHPVFGVGIGRFSAISRYYVTDDYPALRRFAPLGQNAHNNFLQILGELGLPGLAAFLCLIVPAIRHRPAQSATAPETVVYASAMTAGLATFLLSAVFGHPLLIVQVSAAFFFALGLTSAWLPAPSGARPVGQIVVWTGLIVILASLPWRVLDARASARDEEGLSAVVGTLDDVPYRIADAVSSWRIPFEAAVVTLPLRWEAPAPRECEVNVLFDGRVADQVRPDINAWMPIRFRLPPAVSRTNVRVLELRVSDAKCRLMVGPLETVE
jgi:O-antigen ligase